MVHSRKENGSFALEVLNDKVDVIFLCPEKFVKVSLPNSYVSKPDDAVASISPIFTCRLEPVSRERFFLFLPRLNNLIFGWILNTLTCVEAHLTIVLLNYFFSALQAHSDAHMPLMPVAGCPLHLKVKPRALISRVILQIRHDFLLPCLCVYLRDVIRAVQCKVARLFFFLC